MVATTDQERTHQLTRRISGELEQFIADLRLTALETRLLQSLADAAVLKFERDADAIRYFEKELWNRYPAIWLTIITAVDHLSASVRQILREIHPFY